ncbi:MAG: hypothetical protein PHG53_09710 [Phycisphaerae bacterium]|nr:hypothetical protein [Phycisphaerae bacterium]
MERVIKDKEGNKLFLDIHKSKKYLEIRTGITYCFRYAPKQIDELITALQEAKKELEKK